MVVINPVTAISAATGIASFFTGQKASNAQAAQAKQNYKDQKRFQQANAKYAEFSADIQRRSQDVGNQYQYWQQLVNYNQNLSYVNQLRNFELSKAIIQADFVERTRSAAMADYSLQSQALSDALGQQAMADAVSYQQYMVQGLKARAALVAGGQEGQSVDRYVSDFSRQVGDQATLLEINQGFREGQYTRQQAAQVAGYVSQYNSQQFYQLAPYQTPIKPFAPLPTLVMPPPPSMTGAGPSGQAGTINFLNNALGAIGTGISTWQGLQQFTAGGFQPQAQPVSQFAGGGGGINLGGGGGFNLVGNIPAFDPGAFAQSGAIVR